MKDGIMTIRDFCQLCGVGGCLCRGGGEMVVVNDLSVSIIYVIKRVRGLNANCLSQVMFSMLEKKLRVWTYNVYQPIL